MKAPNFWYEQLHLLSLLLLPLSWVFYWMVVLRHFCYRKGIFKIVHFPVPIIVVGNLTVGGTGKTPLVMWLVKALQKKGLHPGVVSRGYGVKTIREPRLVNADSDLSLVGDEPLLMAKHLDCPIVVCADRARAVSYLLDQHYCNVIISDDGLQHYRMGRDVEIVVVDEKRRFGNERLLPAGPLREPLSRLKTVDFLVLNCEDLNLERTDERVFYMQLMPKTLIALNNHHVEAISNRHIKNETVHAIAGIGNPERFFTLLEKLGFSIIRHEFPDHHVFKHSDIVFDDEKKVIMTEKDAIKCQEIADDRHWFLKVAANADSTLADRIIEIIAVRGTAKRGDENDE